MTIIFRPLRALMFLMVLLWLGWGLIEYYQHVPGRPH